MQQLLRHTPAAILLAWLLFNPFAFAAPLASQTLSLTEEERHWLAGQQNILIGTDRSWTPYVKPQENGEVTGIEADILARISALTGTHFQLVLGEWSDMVRRAKLGELHGLALSIDLLRAYLY